MAKLLEIFRQRQQDDWLLGASAAEWVDLTQQKWAQLANWSNSDGVPCVLLMESDPLQFLAGFMACGLAQCPVFLGNPQWGERERQEAIAIAQPDLIWVEPGNPRLPGTIQRGRKSSAFSQFTRSLHDSSPIFIPTGGSSGQLRFVIHTWDTLTASVSGFCQHFQWQTINSCCVLPFYHVSGLMQFVRSLTTGGKLAIAASKALERSDRPNLYPPEFCISLVPTQLQRLLQQPELVDWLAQFSLVLLGGAPAWAELLVQAKQMRIPVGLTYGMTETASQIATLHPQNFLAGDWSCGRVLPHAQITIQDGAGRSLPPGQVGNLVIAAKSLGLGYWEASSVEDRTNPQPAIYRSFQGFFQPDDLGYFDSAGNLHILGRSSDKIITGGENVFPVEVEAAIRATGLVSDVCVLGVPQEVRNGGSLKHLDDRQWGEVVAAIYVPVAATLEVAALQKALEGKLSRFKQPKRWVAIAQLPRNAQGKLDRTALKSRFF